MSKNPEELTPLTLTKRVMAGNTSREYLEAFQKLNPNDIPFTSLNYSRFDIIKMWNSLQSTPNKVRYFTFSLVHDNPRVQETIKKIYDHDKYAYILHDKDKSAERKHCHYVLMFSSPRSFKSVANDLEIPVTMLQKVYSKKGILDYLTHENDPNKHHYEFSEITANFDIENEKKGDDGFPFLEFYHDYCDVRNNVITVDDFIKKWNMYCATLSITGAIGMAERLFNASSTGASLSTRSECRVPNPCSSPPEKIAFSKIDPNAIEVLEKGSPYSILSETGNVRKNNKKLPNNILNTKRKDLHGY